MIRYAYSQMQKYTVALLGRSSVGKSSLFNKLQNGENMSITSKEKNITRDRKEAISELFNVPVRFVDTAGIENVALNRVGVLQQKMLMQTINALEYSDLALFVVDARVGLTSQDYQIAGWLRKLINQQSNVDIQLVDQLKDLKTVSRLKHAILVANKSENDKTFAVDIDSQLRRLGFGDPLYVSALDGTGFQDLLGRIQDQIPASALKEQQDLKKQRRQKYDKLKQQCKKEFEEQMEMSKLGMNIKQWEKEFDQANPHPSDNSDLDDEDIRNPIYQGSSVQQKPGVSSDNLQKRKAIQLSIVGRVNVGKSSLVNTLLEQDRVIADATPGTTRDIISTEWVYKGQKIQLVDTAGIEGNKKKLSELDVQITSRSKYIMRYSNVVILMIDSMGAFRDIDLDLAQTIVKEGRAIVLAVNKWDMVDNEYKARIIKYLKRQLGKQLGEVVNCPLITISAEKKVNINELMDQVLLVYDRWNTRISTGLLNDWLNKIKKTQNLPADDGDKLKIRFIAQVKVRPPTFALFINEGSLFKNNYLQFLRHRLAAEFNIEGVPVRFIMRDIQYSKERKVLEKSNESSVRDQLLKRRRIAKLAKSKLESLRKNR